jgi:hypothetical protein
MAFRSFEQAGAFFKVEIKNLQSNYNKAAASELPWLRLHQAMSARYGSNATPYPNTPAPSND